MNNFKMNNRYATVCFTLLALVITLIPPKVDAAPTASNVNVVNTPSVLVTNPGTNPVPVQVRNTGTNPVPVTDKTNATQTFQLSSGLVGISPNPNSAGFFILPAIPSGKRFVIQSVTALAQVASTHFIALSQFGTTTSGVFAVHYIPLNLQGTGSGSDFYEGAISGTWYADAGTQMQIGVFSDISVLMVVTFSGYLVNMP